MSRNDADDAMLALLPEDAEVIHQSSGAVAAIVKSEVEAQIDAAHRNKRSIRRFLDEATSMACLDVETAEGCIYTVPRGGKVLTGPSIRLAEIIASAYGNLHIATRIADIDDGSITAQGLVWDLEKNLKWCQDVRRRITDKKGRRFNEDMITVSGNAAMSIAVRNAIFRAIPRVYVNAIYAKAKEIAVGNAKTFAARRDQIVDRLSKLGITKERILSRIDRRSVEEVTMDDLEILVGLGTAVKNNDVSIDDAFPAGLEPVRGTLDAASFKAGREPNRGHEDTGIEGLRSPQPGQPVPQPTPAPAPAPIPSPQPPLPTPAPEGHEGVCSSFDLMDIEQAAKRCGVDMKAVLDHVTTTMGLPSFGRIPLARKDEVMKWIDAKKKR